MQENVKGYFADALCEGYELRRFRSVTRPLNKKTAKQVSS